MAGLRKLRGKYYVRVFLPGGKEKLIPTKTGDRKLAEARKRQIEEREFLVKAKLAEDMAKTATGLFDAVDEYLRDCRSRLRDTTYENYELALRNLKDCWGDINLRQMTAAHFTALRLYLSSRVGPTSVNIRLRAIRTFLNWLVATGKLESLPGKLATIKIDGQLPKFFTPGEIDKILDHVVNPRMKATIRLLAETGLRRSELFKCTLEDGYLHLRQTKGHRDRLVAIPLDLVSDFHLAMGDPYHPASVSRSFQEAIAAAGIEPKGRSLHCLRHTFALREYFRTGDVYLVRGLLGHRHVATTEIYLQFPEDYLERVFGSRVMRHPTREILDAVSTQKPAFQA